MNRPAVFPVVRVLLLLLTGAGTVCEAQPLLGSARSASLARANIAEIGQMETMHDNPGTLAFGRTWRFMASHVYGHAGVPVSDQLTIPAFVHDRGTIAAAGAVSNIRYALPDRREGLFRYTAEAGAGYEFLPGIGLGVSFGGSRILGPGVRYQAISTTVGLVYAPLPQISYTLVFRGCGAIRPGSAEGIPTGYLPDTGRSLQIGISMRHPSPMSMRRPILTISVANERMFETRGLVYRGGIELFPFDFLALRSGYILGGGIDRPAFGAGLIIGIFRGDYVFSRELQHRGNHGFSVSMDL